MNAQRFARLRRLTPREAIDRARQAWAKRRERAGRDPTINAFCADPAAFALSESRCASTEQLLESFSGSDRPGLLFGGLGAPGDVLARAVRRDPTFEGALLDRAHRAERGRFDLLGLRNLDFGDPVAWSLEPRTGRTAPQLHWSRIDFLDPGVAGDKKITWELGRHRHLVDLAMAALLTRDGGPARTCVARLESWIEQNPPKVGIHWASSLESAYRAIAWCWTLSLLRGTGALEPASFARALAYLVVSARHVRTYLSTWFSPNTHLTGEALGLLYVGAFFPGLRESTQWIAHGWEILEREAAVQVLDDGVYFERATYYHRYTVDIYIHALLIGRALRLRTDSVEDRLRRALRHLLHVVMPDGTTPLIGDDDGGRVLFLDGRAPDDFRSPLATGALLLDDLELLHVAGPPTEETDWLLGPGAAERAADAETRPPACRDAAFLEGGLIVARDGWDGGSGALVFDVGPHGSLACGHSHADALSFVLHARGARWLIDPGTYTYTSSRDERDRFRGSAAHNAVVVDGEDSSAPGAAFKWRTRAEARLLNLAVHERAAWFVGTHDGYERLADPVTHVRGILALRGEYWLVLDELRSKGRHTYDVLFQFDPSCEVCLGEGRIEATLAGRGLALDVCTAGPGSALQVRRGYASFCYGARQEHAVGSSRFDADGHLWHVSWLRPRAAADGPAEIRKRPSERGGAVELAAPGGRDLFAWSGGAGIHVPDLGMQAAAAAVWARFDGAGAVREWLALDASEIRVGGEDAWRGETRSIVAGRRVAGAWTVGFGAPPPAGPDV